MRECQCSESEYLTPEPPYMLIRRVHPWHDCDYVRLRNSQIPVAFALARRRQDQDEIDSLAFMREMDRLVAAHYAAQRGRP